MINALGNTKWYIEKNIDISYLYFGDLFFVLLSDYKMLNLCYMKQRIRRQLEC